MKQREGHSQPESEASRKTLRKQNVLFHFFKQVVHHNSTCSTTNRVSRSGMASICRSRSWAMRNSLEWSTVNRHFL